MGVGLGRRQRNEPLQCSNWNILYVQLCTYERVRTNGSKWNEGWELRSRNGEAATRCCHLSQSRDWFCAPYGAAEAAPYQTDSNCPTPGSLLRCAALLEWYTVNSPLSLDPYPWLIAAKLPQFLRLRRRSS
jgi:hypothetical protein